MAKVRVSTTVDAVLLFRAREAHGATTDASLLEVALVALLDARRGAQVDARRGAQVDAAYDLAYSSASDTDADADPDAWGDLAAWRRHAGST